MGGGSTGSRSGGGLSSSCSGDGSGIESSALAGLPSTDEELCGRVRVGDSGR